MHSTVVVCTRVRRHEARCKLLCLIRAAPLGQPRLGDVISLADTGAHCGVLSDASIPTYFIAYLCRDRERGKRFELETAVMMHTRDSARSVGLEDRGTLEVGMKADINLIDYEKLKVLAPEVIYDLPAGGRRMFQGAEGYRATIVSGEVVMEDGLETGARPGKLIRGAQPAPESSRSAA